MNVILLSLCLLLILATCCLIEGMANHGKTN